MSRYVTVGVDDEGEVYGLEIDEKGDWIRNSLGLSTSCVVIRPVDKNTLEELREDPESFRDTWKLAVEADRTDKGLDDFFEDLKSEECVGDEDWPGKDDSWVYELLEDEGNPTVRAWNELREKEIGKLPDDDDGEDDDDSPWFDDDGQPMSFRKHVESVLEGTHGSEETPPQNFDTTPIAAWESSGWWSPKHPFAIELADRKLLDEYYDHLRKTSKDWVDRKRSSK